MFIPTTTIRIMRLMKQGEDDNGEDVLAPVEIATDVPADIQGASSQIPVEVAGETIIADCGLFCGRDVDIKENDTVYDLGNMGDNIEAYRVLSTNEYGLVPHIEASLVSGSKNGVGK